MIRQIIEKNDIWFDLDIYADKKAIIEYLVTSKEWSAIPNNTKKQLLKRFIIECYGIEGYEEVCSAYPGFDYYLLTCSTFPNDEKTHVDYISYMKEKNLKYVIMSYTWLSDSLVKMYKDNNIGIFCFVVNSNEDAVYCKKMVSWAYKQIHSL